MQITYLDIAEWIVTYLILGAIGYSVSKKFKQPVALSTFVLIVIATIAAGNIGIGAGRLIDISGFRMYINRSLQAFGLGMIVGIYQMTKFRLSQKEKF